MEQSGAGDVPEISKDAVLPGQGGVEAKNITNITDSLPDIFVMLRDYDRREILKALGTGSPVVPLGLAWCAEGDVRSLASPEPQQNITTNPVTQRSHVVPVSTSGAS